MKKICSGILERRLLLKLISFKLSGNSQTSVIWLCERSSSLNLVSTFKLSGIFVILLWEKTIYCRFKHWSFIARGISVNLLNEKLTFLSWSPAAVKNSMGLANFEILQLTAWTERIFSIWNFASIVPIYILSRVRTFSFLPFSSFWLIKPAEALCGSA